jgi:hypothetical protein
VRYLSAVSARALLIAGTNR